MSEDSSTMTAILDDPDQADDYLQTLEEITSSQSLQSESLNRMAFDSVKNVLNSEKQRKKALKDALEVDEGTQGLSEFALAECFRCFSHLLLSKEEVTNEIPSELNSLVLIYAASSEEGTSGTIEEETFEVQYEVVSSQSMVKKELSSTNSVVKLPEIEIVPSSSGTSGYVISVIEYTESPHTITTGTSSTETAETAETVETVETAEITETGETTVTIETDETVETDETETVSETESLTKGRTTSFSVQQQDTMEEVVVEDLEVPIGICMNIDEDDVAHLEETVSCQFFNLTLQDFSTEGIETDLENVTYNEDGSALLCCYSTHLSDFTIFWEPAPVDTTSTQPNTSSNQTFYLLIQ